MSYGTLVDAATLAKHLEHPGWVVVDCRFNLADPDEGLQFYAEGHIPGARYAHLDQDLSSAITPTSGRHPLPDTQQLCSRLGAWGIAPDTQVVAYDNLGGAMAARFWWLLRWLGHESVALLDGGIGAWSDAGYGLDGGAPTAASVTYNGAQRPEMVVSSEEVMDNLRQERFLLVDARSPERFRGEQEPIDPVAGRVPGALNRPLQNNLDPRGQFLSQGQLREQWLALIGDWQPNEVVHMCGSGVTACHNLLAMEHAGLSGSRVYAGSWSEWIRDPERPVATTGP